MPYPGMEQGPNGETVALPSGDPEVGQVLRVASVVGVIASGEWHTPSAGVTDHGALSGLSDDDHTQYHNDTRGDARYAKKAGDTFTGLVNVPRVAINSPSAIPQVALTIDDGIEFTVFSGAAVLQAYARGGAGYLPATWNALTHSFQISAVEKIGVASTLVSLSVPLRVPQYTDATLPTAGQAGRIAYSSDSGLVHDNGTNWRKATYTNV